MKYVKKNHTFTLPDGTKKRVYFCGKTEKEALAKMNKAIYDYEAGQYLLSNSMTVRRFVDQLKQSRELTEDVKRRLENHVCANIGGVKVQDLKPSHIDLCLNMVRDSSSSNIDKTWNVCSMLCKALIRDDLILRNPMDKVDKPHGSKGKRRALTAWEQRIFLKTLEKPQDYFWAVIYGCGLRPGEVRALTWGNVYFDRSICGFPFIRVAAAVKKETQEIGLPKTAAGLRDVPIPDWLVDILLKLKRDNKGSTLVFPAPGGRQLTEQTVKRRWAAFFNRMDIRAGAKTYRNKIVQHSALGQDIKAYFLRHTYRTNLAECGVSQLVAAHWMGHSEAGVNDVGYAHVTDQMLRDAYGVMNLMMNTKVKEQIGA